jgi:hypothetical protein
MTDDLQSIFGPVDLRPAAHARGREPPGVTDLRRVTARWLAVIAVACASSRAAAEPAIVLVRCAALDLIALRDALEVELAVAPTRNQPPGEPTIVVHCSDAMMAHVAIEPLRGIPIARTLDLGEVPDRLRIKFLAVAAVEMIAIDEPSPSPAKLVVVDRGEPLAIVARSGTRSAAPTASTAAIVPRLGMRWYARTAAPLAHAAVDVELGRFALGLASSIGSTDYEIGSVTPYVVTATASTRSLCTGRSTRGCIRAHGELGVAGVMSRRASSMVIAHDARAPYAQLGIGLDGEHALGALSAVIAIDAAWSEGLIATVEDRRPVRLDGAVLTVLAGLRWRP